MTLSEYRKRRRFGRTPEPPGSSDVRTGEAPFIYAVQKHIASHLHYDLRLEWRGVLLSWAIPKGPSLDPLVKRLAIRTEDHPVEYSDFEGVIPRGQYGAGTVMLWDRGTWHPENGTVDLSLQNGEIRFTIRGRKLHGAWVLIRIARLTKGSVRPVWLLIKQRDEYASSRNVTEENPRSVLSGRLLGEIARKEGGDIARASKGDPVRTVPTGAKTAALPEPAARRRRSL